MAARVGHPNHQMEAAFAFFNRGRLVVVRAIRWRKGLPA
jgi:hypothetical protein